MAKLTAKQAEKLFDDFEKLPDGKRYIDGEGLWVKKIPDSPLVIVNNNPLSDKLHWQDIIDGLGDVVYRRWEARFWFGYPSADTEEADIERRKLIREQLKQFGDVNFFIAGRGFVWVRKKLPSIPKKAHKALKKLCYEQGWPFEEITDAKKREAALNATDDC